MASAHEKEDWDLPPSGHLARAQEILAVVPKPGELISEEQERMALAARHGATAIAKYALLSGQIYQKFAAAAIMVGLSGSESDPIHSTGKEGPDENMAR